MAYLLFVIITPFLLPSAVNASTFLDGIDSACMEKGDCQLNDILQVAINSSNFILGIFGSLALLAFVYGGLMFLIFGGSSDRVNIGKKSITGAVIGLVIVFSSYTIVNYILSPYNENWATVEGVKNTSNLAQSNTTPTTPTPTPTTPIPIPTPTPTTPIPTLPAGPPP